jgi:hypothetical protein
MIEWEVTYTADRDNYSAEIIVAPTYTMAVLAFIIKYPNYDYSMVREVRK